MSRKNRRLKALTEPSKAKKGTVYLDPEMDEVTEALWHQRWATEDERRLMGVPGYQPPATQAMTVTSTAKHPQIDSALVRSLLALQGTVLAPEEGYVFDKPITWVLAGNGIFQVRQTSFGQLVVRVDDADLPGLPKWTPPDYEWPLPKMPWPVFAPAIAFLRWVKQTYNTEGLVRGYWEYTRKDDLTAGWTIDVPPQKVTGVSVDVANTVADPGLGLFALELHSHPGSSSNFSGTDDANEQRERLFGCVAGLTDMPTPPNFHWRIGTGTALWKPIKLSDIVRCDETLTFTMTPLACLSNALAFDPFGKATFPEEWKAQVDAPSKKEQKDWASLSHADALEQQQDLMEEMRRRERVNRFDSGSSVNGSVTSRRYY